MHSPAPPGRYRSGSGDAGGPRGRRPVGSRWPGRGDYDPRTVGYIVRFESRDGGRTWSEGQDAAFPNPNAAVEFLNLRSGRLVLIVNDSMNRRTPLTAARSSDQDRTWPIRRNIRVGDDDSGYPSAFRARDGRIHVVFTSDCRSVVNHAVFDEDCVLDGGGRTARP
jgi:predicted neuraminidase